MENSSDGMGRAREIASFLDWGVLSFLSIIVRLNFEFCSDIELTDIAGCAGRRSVHFLSLHWFVLSKSEVEVEILV